MAIPVGMGAQRAAVVAAKFISVALIVNVIGIPKGLISDK